MDKFQNKYRIASARAHFWDYGWNAAYFVTICTQDRICWFGKVLDGEMVLSDIGEIAKKCWEEIPQHFPFVKLGAFVVMPNHVHGIVIIDKTENDTNVVSNVAVETQYFASLQPPLQNIASPPPPQNIALQSQSQTQNIASQPPPQNIALQSQSQTQYFASLQPPLQNIASPPPPQNIALQSQSQTQNIASLPPPPPTTTTQNKFGPQSQNLASIIRGFKIGVTKNARLLQPDFMWQSRYHDHIIRDDQAYHNISEYIINNPTKWAADKFYL
jgi:putative transposase